MDNTIFITTWHTLLAYPTGILTIAAPFVQVSGGNGLRRDWLSPAPEGEL